jgi:hypothetical protein
MNVFEARKKGGKATELQRELKERGTNQNKGNSKTASGPGN